MDTEYKIPQLTHSFLDRLDGTAERVPDKTAYVSENATITFSQLRQKSEAVGSYLATRVAPHERVAILMARDVWSPCAILGAIEAGAVAAPVDPTMPVERFMMIAETMQPSIVLYDDSGRELAEALKQELSCPIVSYFEAEKAPVDREALNAIRGKISQLDPIQLFYTSGSTGVPKGVVYTHRTILNYMDRAADYTEYINPDQVYGNQAPLFYANAINDLYTAINCGCTVHFIPYSLFMFPEPFLKYLTDNRITVLIMTPLNYIYIADSGLLTPGSMPFLKGVYFSGETVPYEKMQVWARAACNGGCWNIYGATESPYMVQIQVMPDDDYVPGTLVPAGYPMRDVKVLVLNENGDAAGIGEVGEIYIATPWMSAGYYRNRELTEKHWVRDPQGNGWDQTYYRSGDLGWWDESGRLHVHGRNDTMIKHRGYRMDVADVDEALRAVEGWQNGCCLFDEKEDLLYCFWTGTLTERELQSALSEKLQKFMIPNRWVYLPELPRTSSGKLDRMALKSGYFGK